MSEILTIRLSSDDGATIPWLVWSPSRQEVIASGNAADLSQLGEYAHERDVYVLADSTTLTLAEIQVPAGSERQLETVLPFLLEEELAQDVEQIHVSLLKKKGDMANVAVISRQQIEQWLESLAGAGLVVKRLIPDCLCLPMPQDGLTAVELDDKWLLRNGEFGGVCAEWSWLPMWFRGVHSPVEAKAGDENSAAVESQSAEEKRVEPAGVACFSPLPESAPDNWRAEEPELVMQMLAKGALVSKATLLTGRYRQQNPVWKYLAPWRYAAVAAVLLATVLGAEQVLSIYKLEDQASAYRAQSEQRFRSLMNKQRVPGTSYIRRTMNDEIKSLSNADSSTGVIGWMAELGPELAKVPGISLQSIRYDKARGELRINARGSDFADFEKLRSALSNRYNTDLGQLNRDESAVTGAYVLRSK